MALRTATAPDLTYAVEDMEPGDQLVYVDPDTILDNQDWCTQRKSIISIDCFYPLTTTAAAYATLATGRFAVATQANYVGAPATTACWRVGVLCWTNDVATDYDIRVATAGGNDSANFVGTTTPAWRTIPIVNAAYDARTGAQTGVSIAARRNAGVGTVYVAGFGLML